jgi:succinate-semialdehyde dehydrogenase/glutarate-semialdehyde dehydrogenase
MIIGSEQVAGSSGKFIEVVNPSTEAVVGRVPAATAEEVDLAVKTAAEAFKVWRETPAAERAGAMMKLIQAVRANIDDLATTLTQEQGKPLWQAKGEINGFCAVIEYYAQEARRIQGKVLESDARDKFVYVLRHPLGVIAAIPPWNDPLHLLSRMIGPAMAAGCTVVAKPSSDTPLTTIKAVSYTHLTLPTTPYV